LAEDKPSQQGSMGCSNFLARTHRQRTISEQRPRRLRVQLGTLFFKLLTTLEIVKLLDSSGLSHGRQRLDCSGVQEGKLLTALTPKITTLLFSNFQSHISIVN
jgi:hypothetical protein